ncbi:MAG: prepilin-type N-terminal cleavage/methylation domain-containing protein [Verrucomicrobia bacterium]|nr:prepilin-type N-terminal cleavage/methylation domain-containing protein [Verrucomicrobiota bacterium]
MSPISDLRVASARGFTLVELMVALSLGAIVIAGIFAAYLFLGRNLTRMVNIQQQEVKSRRALKMFTQDLSSAIQLTTSTDSQIVVTTPVGVTLTGAATTSGNTTVTCSSTSALTTGASISGSGIPSGVTVSSITNGTTFVISSNATATASGLVLSAIVTTSVTYIYTAGGDGSGTLTRTDSAGTTTLLTNLSAFDFSYYNESGTAVSSSPQSVKSVEFTFTSAVGTSSVGTRASYTTVSPRVVLRNKPALAN